MRLVKKFVRLGEGYDMIPLEAMIEDVVEAAIDSENIQAWLGDIEILVGTGHIELAILELRKLQLAIKSLETEIMRRKTR